MWSAVLHCLLCFALICFDFLALLRGRRDQHEEKQRARGRACWTRHMGPRRSPSPAVQFVLPLLFSHSLRDGLVLRGREQESVKSEAGFVMDCESL